MIKFPSFRQFRTFPIAQYAKTLVVANRYLRHLQSSGSLREFLPRRHRISIYLWGASFPSPEDLSQTRSIRANSKACEARATRRDLW